MKANEDAEHGVKPMPLPHANAPADPKPGPLTRAAPPLVHDRVREELGPDVQIETFTGLEREPLIRLTHIPSGITVSRVGWGRAAFDLARARLAQIVGEHGRVPQDDTERVRRVRALVEGNGPHLIAVAQSAEGFPARIDTENPPLPPTMIACVPIDAILAALDGEPS